MLSPFWLSDVIAAVENSSIAEQVHSLYIRVRNAQGQVEPLSEFLGPNLHEEINNSFSEMLVIRSRLRNTRNYPYRSSTTYQGNTGEHTKQLARLGGGGGLWFCTIANRVFNMCLADQRGRPAAEISHEQMVPQIARMLRVSASRVYGQTVRQMYADITDMQLDDLINGINLNFPNSGYRLASSVCFKAWGIGLLRVIERRVRESHRRIDPISVAYRHSRRGIQFNDVDTMYHTPMPFGMWMAIYEYEFNSLGFCCAWSY